MGGQEVDIGRRKGEPRAAGTARYKGEKVNRGCSAVSWTLYG